MEKQFIMFRLGDVPDELDDAGQSPPYLISDEDGRIRQFQGHSMPVVPACVSLHHVPIFTGNEIVTPSPHFHFLI